LWRDAAKTCPLRHRHSRIDVAGAGDILSMARSSILKIQRPILGVWNQAGAGYERDELSRDFPQPEPLPQSGAKILRLAAPRPSFLRSRLFPALRILAERTFRRSSWWHSRSALGNPLFGSGCDAALASRIWADAH